MDQEEKRKDFTFPVLYIAFVFIVWFLVRLRFQEKIKKSGLTKADYIKIQKQKASLLGLQPRRVTNYFIKPNASQDAVMFSIYA